MSRDVYRYRFTQGPPFPDVLATLDLAVIAIQSLHGEARSRLDVRFSHDAGKRAIVIDASTTVGQELNEVFVGFARLEFGEKTFQIERVLRTDCASTTPTPVGAAA